MEQTCQQKCENFYKSITRYEDVEPISKNFKEHVGMCVKACTNPDTQIKYFSQEIGQIIAEEYKTE